ncbi:MAG: thiamine pyrophosphate-dependent enzyme, partial [Dehalococcoidia bacterium]
HFGADNPLGYRSEEEQKFYMDRDCIVQARAYILDGSYADEEELDQIDSDCLEAVSKATKFANDSPFPDPDELTENVYVSY